MGQKNRIVWDRYWLDIPSGIAGGLIMGLIVYVINLPYGWLAALPAAAKQAAYTFFLGGLLIKGLKQMCRRISVFWLAVVGSALAFSIFTIVLVYGVHSLKGTPDPVGSVLPTVLLAPPGFFVLALRDKRKQVRKISVQNQSG